MIHCPCNPRVNNIMRDVSIKAVVECYLLYLEATHSVSEWKINTLWTGDADLRLYITTVQDG